MVQQIQITVEFGDEPIVKLTELASSLQEILNKDDGEIISCLKVINSKKRPQDE